VVLNPKGGSGKTTIATNIAAHYATQGRAVVLLDEDPQGSATRWLSKRPESAAPIHGISSGQPPTGVTRAFAMRIPPETERIVVDTSAALADLQLTDAIRGADRIIVPVMPSDIDIHAATRCIASLLLKAKVDRHDNRLAIVANRVKTNTLVFKSLMKFLGALAIPLAGLLRDTQHYVHAVAGGLGVHELGNVQRKELTQWIPLIDWVERGTIQPQSSLYGDRPSMTSNVTSIDSIRPRQVVRSGYN
jgi:chromosome partitioning protein